MMSTTTASKAHIGKRATFTRAVAYNWFAWRAFLEAIMTCDLQVVINCSIMFYLLLYLQFVVMINASEISKGWKTSLHWQSSGALCTASKLCIAACTCSVARRASSFDSLSSQRSVCIHGSYRSILMQGGIGQSIERSRHYNNHHINQIL